MNEEMRTRTFEELLINRVAKAFESMDNVNAEFFDEILDELEMLFKLKPDMYEQLIKWKKYHESIFQQNLDLAKQKVSLLEDEIAQDITIKYYQTKSDWAFRKDLLETMLNILNEFKLIPFTNPEYAEIETIEPAEQPELPLEPEVTQQPPLPPPPPQLPVQPPIPMEPVEQLAQTQPPPVPVELPVISSPTIKPTNIPKPYSEPPQQIIEQPDDELVREANRLAREEDEIRKASEQPPQKPPSARPAQKKGLGLFKRM